MPKNSATRRSCERAMSNGFSRRWLSGTSSVVTSAPSLLETAEKPGRVYACFAALSDPKSDSADARRAAVRGPRDGLDPVGAAPERRAAGTAAGQAEDVPPGQRVTQAREQAERLARGGEQPEIEPRDRQELR